MIEKRKLVLVGTGFVGMSMAYSLQNQGGINELVLIDVDRKKAEGEAMDLAHGISCAPSKMDIKAGDYSDCKDADIVVITAGLAQKPGQTRLELVKANAKIMKEITKNVIESGFNGIFLVASNPVDLMTYVVCKESGFDKSKVIGSGTVLDTSRLRYLIAKKLNVSTKNIHAYIMGEHGDSSFVPWNKAYIGCKILTDIIKQKGEDEKVLDDIYHEVQQAAYEIIERKRATYYAIGLALTKIIKAIINDENEIMTISTYLDGEYNHKGIYMGVPTIVNSKGAREILNLKLTEEEQEKLGKSAKILEDMIKELDKSENL